MEIKKAIIQVILRSRQAHPRTKPYTREKTPVKCSKLQRVVSFTFTATSTAPRHTSSYRRRCPAPGGPCFRRRPRTRRRLRTPCGSQCGRSRGARGRFPCRRRGAVSAATRMRWRRRRTRDGGEMTTRGLCPLLLLGLLLCGDGLPARSGMTTMPSRGWWIRAAALPWWLW